MVGDGMQSLAVCLVTDFRKSKSAELSHHLEPRRREIDLLVAAVELRSDAAAHGDAIELLQEIDMEIGAPILAVGDAAEADRLLQRDRVADGAVFDLAQRDD
jgi:hypothetical protein